MNRRMRQVVVRGMVSLAVAAASVLAYATLTAAATPGTRPVSLTLSTSQETSVAGQKTTGTTKAVTYTATVTPTAYTKTGTSTTPATTTPAPTGTVEFLSGGLAIAGCTAATVTASTTKPDATATCTPSPTTMKVGTYAITAKYSGDTTYAGATGGPFTQVVVAGYSQVTVTNTGVSPHANPSYPGVAVTYTATVTPTVPTVFTAQGTINFLSAHTTAGTVRTTLICTGALVSATATATCTQTGSDLTGTGSYTITGVFTPSSTSQVGGTNPLVTTPHHYTQKVVKNTPTVTVKASPASPSTYGTQVQFVAVVKGSGGYTSTPSGTVTFKDGTTVVCAATAATPNTPVAGDAQVTCTATLPAGTGQAITATYVPTASTLEFNGATATITYTVGQVPVTETLATTSTGHAGTPSLAGVPVSYTLTVTGVLGGTAPTGTVTFEDGGKAITSCTTVPLTFSSGVIAKAACTEPGTALTTGTHTITAHYSGNADYKPATPVPTKVQTVDANTTTTAVTTSGPVYAGVAHTWAATVKVSPTTVATVLHPTGTVTFTDSTSGWTCTTGALVAGPTTGVATVPTSGAGACTEPATKLTARIHTVTAVYSGDVNFTTSTNLLINKLQTITAQGASDVVTSSAPTGAQVGTAVTYTAVLTATDASTLVPTGTVTFTDTFGGTVKWTCASPTPVTTGAGTATYTCTEPKTDMTGTPPDHHIVASYPGNTYYAPASGSYTQTVKPATSTPGRTATITLGTSGSPSYPGVTVVYTAVVTGSSIFAPTGTVTFSSPRGWIETTAAGATTSCAAPVSTGTSTTYRCTEKNVTGHLTVGSQTVSATFNGDVNYSAVSTSATQDVVQVVTQDSTTLAVTSSAPNGDPAGVPVTFTTTVTPTHGHVHPTGTVHYSNTLTGFACTSGTLVPAATGYGSTTPAATPCAIPGRELDVGTYPIVAVYHPTGGDYLSSDNAASPYVQKVVPDTTTTSVTGPSGGPFPAGQPLTFTAIVTPAGTSALTLSGTVTFRATASGNTCTAPVSGVGAQTVTCTMASWTFSAGAIADVTATYNGNRNFSTSTGSTATSGTSPTFVKSTTSNARVSVTSTSLAGSPAGQSVTYTATVSGPTGGVLTPTGTVTFYDTTTGTKVAITGCSTLILPTTAPHSGSVTIQCTELGAKLASGPKDHVITVSYSGDTNFGAKVSTPFHQWVLPSTTTIVLTAATPSNGTVQSVHTTVTLKATVTGTPSQVTKPLTPATGVTGRVDFLLNGVAIPSCTDEAITGTSVVTGKRVGTVTCSGFPMPQGTDTFTAVYHDFTGASDYSTAYTTRSGKPTSPPTAPTTTTTAPWSAVTYQVSYYGTVSNVTSSPTTPATGQPVTLYDSVVPSSGATTLPTDPNPIVFTVNGSPVTCTATKGDGRLNSSNPPLATCYVVAGLPGGSDSVQATYPTDGTYAPSVGSLSLQVATAATSTTMTVGTATGNTTTAISGQTLEFSATVTPQSPGTGSPSGTVAITSPSVPGVTLCTVTLTAGHGICYDSSIPVPAGNPNPVLFQATYSGNATFGSSSTSLPATPAQGTLGVNALDVLKESATVSSFTVSPTSPIYGQSTTFTVALSPEIAGTVATGNIGVAVSGATSTLCTITLVTSSDDIGSCTFTPSAASQNYLPAGPLKLTATYLGSRYFAAPAFGNQSTVVAKSTDTVDVSVSPQNPIYGQLVTFDVTVVPAVAGTIPTGTVAVTGPGSSTPLCTVTLTASSGGSGTCTSAKVLVAQENATFTATYGGSTDFLASGVGGNAGPGTAVANILQRATVTTLTVTPSSATYGSTEKFKVTVTPTPAPSPTVTGASPTGAVVITSPGVPQVLCTVSNLKATATTVGKSTGTCTSSTTAVIPVGTHVSYRAAYGGDTNFLASTGSATNTVGKAASTTSLALSKSTVAYGSEASEVFTVTVAHASGTGTPSGGTAIVKQGSTVLCTATVTSGKATCSPSATALAAATYTGTTGIVATYTGSNDPNFGSSTTATSQPLTVTKASTTSTVSLSPTTVVYGNEQATTLTATVTAGASGPVVTGGTETFSAGFTVLCSATVAAGRATCVPSTTTLLTASSTPYAVTATYGGSVTGNFAASPVSSHQSLLVTPDPVTFTVSVSTTRVAFGHEGTAFVSWTATPEYPVFTSTSTFTTTTYVGSTGICATKSTCELSTWQIAPGTYPVSVTFNHSFSKDFSIVQSSVSGGTLTVTKGASTTTLTTPPTTGTYGNEKSLAFTPVVASTPT
ncbi:MAG: Ig-like domain repeat protein, partial [Acidimicrobiales bacterium]